jgi:AraC-like DNA-binding protein
MHQAGLDPATTLDFYSICPGYSSQPGFFCLKQSNANCAALPKAQRTVVRKMKPVAQRERIAFSRPPELPGVEVMSVEHSARRWCVLHETYAVVTILDVSERSIEWLYRRKIHRTEAKNIMLIEPGEVYASTKITPPAVFRVLCVDPSLVECAAKELAMTTSQPHLKFVRVTDPLLFRAFALLHSCLENGANTLERQSHFSACIRLLVDECTEKSSTTGLKQQHHRLCLLRARDFIWEYYTENLTLDELVTVTGLSRFHLVRAFAAEFGMPPHAYLNQVRLAKAKKSITAGIPLAMVAAEVGFADQSHFTRHFIKTYGVTPARYRKTDRAHFQKDECAEVSYGPEYSFSQTLVS